MANDLTNNIFQKFDNIGEEKGGENSTLSLYKACAPIDWFARLYIEAEFNDFMTNEVPVRQQFDLVDLSGQQANRF